MKLTDVNPFVQAVHTFLTLLDNQHDNIRTGGCFHETS